MLAQRIVRARPVSATLLSPRYLVPARSLAVTAPNNPRARLFGYSTRRVCGRCELREEIYRRLKDDLDMQITSRLLMEKIEAQKKQHEDNMERLRNQNWWGERAAIVALVFTVMYLAALSDTRRRS
ncbi:hypothetical protein C8A01DRAFT_30951 [Parachaetomium inaequale]|uniref:Uncharacterized protein n=1 Tax=Parachaetomium inaequale TaxID=2588326 RepID=A0AAN6PPW3_9PEZI|nr:hypothetical protein C8A01DRAFT_30951 [Parachaetomium inaequale]